MKKILLLSIIYAAISVQAAFAQNPLFPFVVSFDAPDNATNISHKLDAPAGKHGFIRVENGHFVHDKGRIQFWGTNTCFAANFQDKAVSDRMAARLARFGINCVRLHHMDMRDIWGGPDAKTFMEFDKAQLDKLDYFVATLKKHGIYVNINLHVSRTLDERDGFPSKENRIEHDKGLDNYYKPLVEANKKYAKDLLEHVNPYTGNAYKDEPAVAMIEINNENSIFGTWSWRGLERTQDVFRDAFRTEWNQWLKNKYKNNDALAAAWGFAPSSQERLGDELLPSTFGNGYLPKNDPWNWDTGGGAEAPVSNANGVLRFDVRKKGSAAWQPQLLGSGFPVKKDAIYTLTVKAKASKNANINFSIRMNHGPWEGLSSGFSNSTDLTTEWQTLSFTLKANADDDNARLVIGNFQAGIVYEFESISLRAGGAFGLGAQQTFDKNTIPVIWAREIANYPQAMIDDFIDFLYELEDGYWSGMYRFLKDEIKVKQPVSGTQLRYGSTHAQAKLDYCDIHDYWQHHVGGWGNPDWHQRNIALVNWADSAILTDLATRRVYGKPLTVSEYNHPYPNQFDAEGFPLICAFGAFQNWDGIFPFEYASGDVEIRKANGFFATAGHSAKMAHMIACHVMLCEDYNTNADQTMLVGAFPFEKEREIYGRDRDTKNFCFSGIGWDKRLALLYPTALDMTGKLARPANVPAVPNGKRFFVEDKSQNRSLLFDMQIPDKGYAAMKTRSAALFTGFVEEGKEYPFGEGSIKFGKTNLGWSTVTLTKLDKDSSRMLLVATGEILNTGMVIESRGDDRISVGWRWGQEPVRCEGIPAIVELPLENLRCWALDESGNRKQELPVRKTDKGIEIELRPEFKTIWYELNAQD